MKNHLKFTAMLIPLLGLAGCMSSDLPPATPKADKFAPQQVVFSGQDLANSIAIGKIIRTFDTAGIMHLDIPLRVTSEMGLTVDYRITWFDDNRSPVDVPTAWQTKSLNPDVFEYIQANSSSPRARDFQIDFRWAQ